MSPQSVLTRYWREWLRLHELLDQTALVAELGTKLSAPFLSAEGQSSTPEPRGLLYVGQSTNKGLCNEHYQPGSSRAKRIVERQQTNREFIDRECGGRGFWLLFRELNEIVNPNGASYEGAIWSNVAKLGVTAGNPQGLLLHIQSDLAARTLRAEVEAYKPALVVFVTGMYAANVILAATGSSNRDWKKAKKRKNGQTPNVWWLAKGQLVKDWPPCLWLPHPTRGFSSGERRYSLHVAARLLVPQVRTSKLI